LSCYCLITLLCYCLQERLDEYRRLATLGVSFGIESSILDPEETKKIFPLIDADVIQGSLYSPGDGVVDPSKLSNALKQSAIKGGAQVCSCYQGFTLVQGNPEKLLFTYLVKKLYALWNHEFIIIFTKPFTPYSCPSIPLYSHFL
jgi:Glycine/D-amino acid oxidases (deaminating)